MNHEQLAALADVWTERALAAIAEAREATPGEHTGTVDLYVYGTQGRFQAAGGEARYGVDWPTHSLLMAKIAERLRERGYAARLVPFTGALHEPTNLHEPAADERTNR